MKSPQREIASKEISELAGQLKDLSGFGGAGLMALLVSCHYLQRVLRNRRVRGYLTRRWPEVGNELENTVESYWKSASIAF